MLNTENKNVLLLLTVLILTLGLIVSSSILGNGLKESKGNNSLMVRGSAKKQITSDLAVWDGAFSVQSANLPDSYKKLKSDEAKVKDYLSKQGISEKDIIFSSIVTFPNYQIMPNGQQSGIIESYKLTQNVEIKSKDIQKITGISRSITDLINDGIEMQSYPPKYMYTKIADLKVDMIELATKDAKNRADKMLKATGNSVGKLKSANIGVFQITPLYSDDISDAGINDTSSIEKEITSVVTCSFEVK